MIAKKVFIIAKDHSEVFEGLHYTNGLNDNQLSENMLTWEQEYHKMTKNVRYIFDDENIMSSKC